MRNQYYNFLYIICVALLLGTSLEAQFFGRNKVQYENYDFKVMKTKHFDIHFYPNEQIATDDAARMVERWYERLSWVFVHNLSKRQPLILYANHADFKQTTVIGGRINQGTGGVTEGLRNRIVISMTGVYAQNDHVLGHELVHGFPYDIAKSAGQGLRGLNRLPLRMIEGMAEYLSFGRSDAHTAMWMRDAILYDEASSIADLRNTGGYFPYRYGHALWAYIAGRWGDGVIAPLFRPGMQNGLDSAFVQILSMARDTLGNAWRTVLNDTYQPQLKGRQSDETIGRKVLALYKNAGEMNLSPVLSPDGSYVAFLSERNLFTIDLFLANARTGEVLATISSATSDAHDFDALIIPGGYALDRLRRSERIVEFVKDMHHQEKLIAAICHAGWVFVSANVLRNRNVPSFYSFRDDLKNAGARWVDQAVAKDGNIITSRQPDDLSHFCREIINALGGSS